MKSVALKKKWEVTNEVNKLQLQIQIQELYTYEAEVSCKKKSHRDRRTHQRRIKIEVVTTCIRKLNVPIYSSFFNIFTHYSVFENFLFKFALFF